MTIAAQKALKYAQLRKMCGKFAARCWAIKNGVDMRLGLLAVQLMATTEV